MSPDYHVHTIDWDGQITIEVDQSYIDRLPLEDRAARMHLRFSRAQQRQGIEESIDQLTEAVLESLDAIPIELVARAHRPDRCILVMYLRKRDARWAKRVAAQTSPVNATTLTFLDVLVDADECWDFYQRVLLPPAIGASGDAGDNSSARTRVSRSQSGNQRRTAT